MQNVKDLMKDILENGTEVRDRTGVGTISVFGRMLRWDLSKGFPAVTSKRLAWNSVVGELLWFLSGSVDRRDLQQLTTPGAAGDGFDIWKGNAMASYTDPEKFNGYNIGNMYPVYWRRLPVSTCDSIVRLKRREFSDVPLIIEHPRFIYEEIPHETRVSSAGNKFTIIGKVSQGGYLIRFSDTGYLCVVPRKSTVSVKDHLAPSVEGVGFLGYSQDIDTSTDTYKALKRVWQDMLIRCYNPRKNHNTYSRVEVCSRWKCFREFYFDAFTLPGFIEWVKSGHTGYNIDKDYYGSSLYCKEACMFLRSDINKSLNAGGTGNYTVYERNGKFYFNRESIMSSVGKTRKAALPKDTILHTSCDDYLVRPKIFHDQLASIIEEAKSNPESRRLLVDSWNIEHSSEAVLAACHNGFQLLIREGKLSLMYSMRSNDIFLGAPFNIASYALLTHIVASILNIEVGELVFSGGDCHVYLNHVEQVNEMLSNECFDLPTLKMPSITSLDDLENYTVKDFVLENYKSHKTIKAPMAV